MVTLNLPIQSIGIVVGPLLSPPSAPPPIAADSRSVENNEGENEEVDDEVEEEDGGFEEPFLGGAAWVKYSTSSFSAGGALAKSARAVTVAYNNERLIEGISTIAHHIHTLTKYKLHVPTKFLGVN